MRNLPRVGEIMFADSSRSKPVKIVHADDLYDSNGGSPYWE